jgi:nucleotide-binding universal stress UspA family protein
MKTIMLHVHEDGGQASRLKVALDLARVDDGHIACVQVTGIDTYAAEPFGEMFGVAAMVDTIHDQDRLVRQAIEARLREENIRWDWRCFDGPVVETLIAQSRLADVVVISQPTGPRPGVAPPLSIIGDVVMHASAPLLVVPTGGTGLDATGAAMLAWNGSAEAAHAMRAGVSLLRHASAVHIVEVGDDEHAGTPTREAAAYLKRHGIACEVHDWPAKGRSTAVALLHAITELDANYLVMGAYGHSRLREMVLGGVTRALLARSQVPLLLVH